MEKEAVVPMRAPVNISPVPKKRPAVVRFPVAWTPLVVFKLPANELEATVFWVMAPEILAYPPTSKLVEMEAAPATSKVTSGVVLPIPRRLFVESQIKVEEPEAVVEPL